MSNPVTERPVYFKTAAEIRAILDGHKTQMRRIITPQPKGEFLSFLERPIRKESDLPVLRAWFQAGKDERSSFEVTCPYGKPGDRLWVRETWWQGQGPTWGTNCVVYDADKAIGWAPGSGFDNPDLTQFKKRPSIFMPRWASRITLEITGIRVERLQDISGPDCWEEGISHAGWDPELYGSVVKCYRDLWDSINARNRPKLPSNPNSRRYARVKAWLETHQDTTSWDANPWVWVVEFRRLTAGEEENK